MSGAEFFWGQAAALTAAALFLVLERRRLGCWTSALIEAFRVWGVMAISVLTVWLAINAPDAASRIGLAIVGPIVTALLVNNAHLALRRLAAKS